MSLKAKIEAVMYASEEPVTLAQLIGLLGEEAQAEVDALASQQAQLALETADGVELGAESSASADGALQTGDDASPRTADGDAAAEDGAPSAEEATAEDSTAAKSGDEASARAEARAKERTLRNHLRVQVDALIAEYTNGDRGIEVREVAGGYRFATKPEYHDAVRGFIKQLKPPLKLSLQALETLAVIAYKQPVTAPEIGEIRGVDSGGVLGSLIARKLITTAGRKQVIGRPILYKTTREFLLRFGLKDISELPSIEEFEKMAGDLAEMEPAQEEIPMTGEEIRGSVEDAALAGSDEPGAAPRRGESLETAEIVEPMANEHGAQADGTPETDTAPADQDGGEEDAPVEHPADDAVIDGRVSGPDPDYSRDDEENPSAVEAEIQEEEK